MDSLEFKTGTVSVLGNFVILAKSTKYNQKKKKKILRTGSSYIENDLLGWKTDQYSSLRRTDT